ncbi:AMP-binding protein [Ruminiclostridium herbifermentans]|uniref:AMP-binding protein n=1 Tax=Ruminiclostridium herbifermentans TaxID=2488810 RepID=A0A4U7JLU8_9FIRM|nr:AMP-binding protein [Ruminiclostridium herbifermentans]QNU66238.1 AMP-binding protein [Ruminiclostridium herbifermentans]
MRTSEDKNYWLDQIGNNHIITTIDSFLEGNKLNSRLKEYTFTIKNTDVAYKKMKDLCGNSYKNEFAYLVSVLTLLLYSFTGDECVTIGCPIPDIKLGCDAINDILVLKYNQLYESSFEDTLITTKRLLKEALEHANAAIADIFQITESYNPVFDIYASLNNLQGSNHFKGYYSIGFYFNDTNSHLECKITYQESLYKDKAIMDIAKHFIYFFEYVAKNQRISASEIEFIDCLPIQKNERNINFIKNESINSLFSKICINYPAKKALVYRDTYITYDELNNKSELVAKWLLKKDVKNGDVIGIICKSPLNIAIAVIAILKVGAVHLIIDSQLPLNRVEKMSSDCDVVFSLTDEEAYEQNMKAYNIIETQRENDDTALLPNLPHNNCCDDVYVVYTSGTTGTPKGIRIKCKSLINFIIWRNREYSINSEDSILQMLSPSSFDGYLISFYSALLSGATLVCLDKNERADFDKLNKILIKNDVTNMSTNPTFIMNIIACGYTKLFSGFKSIIMGGGHIDSLIVTTLNKLYPDIKLYNEYGPSECCMAVTSHRVMGKDDRNIIGRAIDNTFIFVINKREKHLPPGFIGEICIGGICLADGYIKDSELSAQKFVYHQKLDEMIYKTGDFGYLTESGELVFINRKDRLVKINGYRIDLSEIENALTMMKQIKKAIVIAASNAQLHAYIMLDQNETEMNLDTIYEHLMNLLPAYMIPSKVFQFNDIYLTSSGKPDINKIKKRSVEVTRRINDKEITESQKYIISTIISIWKDTLGLDNIKSSDNFFEIGGNSLKAIKAIAELENRGVSVPDPDAIFKYQTAYDLSIYIASLK